MLKKNRWQVATMSPRLWVLSPRIWSKKKLSWGFENKQQHMKFLQICIYCKKLYIYINIELYINIYIYMYTHSLDNLGLVVSFWSQLVVQKKVCTSSGMAGTSWQLLWGSGANDCGAVPVKIKICWWIKRYLVCLVCLVCCIPTRKKLVKVCSSPSKSTAHRCAAQISGDWMRLHGTWDITTSWSIKPFFYNSSDIHRKL